MRYPKTCPKCGKEMSRDDMRFKISHEDKTLWVCRECITTKINKEKDIV
jgi:ssDNA-binding Zn-finger/Zn-ribbon topoisomerase 1